MRKLLLASLLALSVVTSFAQSNGITNSAPSGTGAATRQEGLEVPFVHKVLANGLEVIVLPDPSVPIVTVEMAARNGSFTEPPELNGLSHLYEHMFFKTNGAIQRREPYLREIGQLGITYNGTTREEVVNYYFTTTSPYLSTAIRFIKDAVRYPVFDESEFAQEKQVVIGEVDRNEANPGYYLNRALNDRLFSKYPTRKNPLGTRESILTSTTDKMRLIQSRYYVPNNMALVVTGDVKPEEVFRLAEQNFGDWQRRAVDPFKEFPLVEHPPLTKSEGVVVEQPVNNVFIQIGWHGPSIGKDDRGTYAADVFSYILSQPDSRFQRNLVDSGLTVGANIGYYTQRNVGPIQIILVTSPDKAKAALQALYNEIAQFDKPDYFTNEELENAKTILESRDLFDREKLSEYAHTLSFWWSSTGIDYFRGYYKNLRSISRDDTTRYVRTYIQGKPHVSVALISAESQAQARLTPEDLIGK
jgi:zinc protease